MCFVYAKVSAAVTDAREFAPWLLWVYFLTSALFGASVLLDTSTVAGIALAAAATTCVGFTGVALWVTWMVGLVSSWKSRAKVDGSTLAYAAHSDI